LPAFFLFCRAGSCPAANLLSHPWEITADRLTHEQNPETVTAEGDVVLLRRVGGRVDMEITADWLFYSVADQYVHARGRVRLTTGEEKITADEAEIFLTDETGSLVHTRIQIPGNSLYFQGDKVRKTGPFSYRVSGGEVTSCPSRQGQSSPWSIHAAETDLTMEGYAVLHHATLRVKDVPLLYSPFLVLPAKTVRETGFLFPEISQSERNGFGIIAPFFVNLSASSDLTLYPGYLEKRGGFMGLEFRYVADPRSKGSFSLNYLNDKEKDQAGSDFNDDGYYRTRRDRYWLRGKADQVLPGDITARLDYDLVSDRDYLQEYREGLVGFDQSEAIYFREFNRDLQEASLPFRQSSLQVTKTMPHYFVGMEMLAVKDVEDVPTSVSPLQKLPAITHDGMVGLHFLPLPTQLVWEADYSNYWRKQGIGDHRLMVQPRLVSNLPLGPWLEGSVSLAGNESLYKIVGYGDQDAEWPSENTKTRSLWSFDSSLATSFVRSFSHVTNSWTTVRHMVRPELGYVYEPEKNQDDLPDLDMSDRIAARNRLRYGVANYLDVTEKEGTDLQHRKLATISLAQVYDIAEARRDLLPGEARRPFSDVLLEVDAFPQRDFAVHYDTTLSVHGQGVTRYEFGLQWKKEELGMLSANYLYDVDESREKPYFYAANSATAAHSLNLSGEIGITGKVIARGFINHSFSDAKSRDIRLALAYQPSCWAVETSFSKTLNDSRVGIMFSLAGLGKLVDLGFSQLQL